MRLFSGNGAHKTSAEKQRIPRHSSGWEVLRAFLLEQESLRVLDIGPTSAANINLLTSWGHSVYMADLVTESKMTSWNQRDEQGQLQFRTEGFLQNNLPLEGRPFDVVLFWDAADYLPTSAVPALYARLHDTMTPGGKLLIFSHIKPENGFRRYHLRDDSEVDLQPINNETVKNIYTNRQMETLLQSFASHRFFLAKDNLREILVNR